MAAINNDWESYPLTTLCKKLRGVSYNKDEVTFEQIENYIPILRANNISDNEINFEYLVYVPPKKVSPQQLLKAGDVVIAMSSGSKSVVGKAAQLRNEWKGSFGAFCGALRLTTDKVHPAFFGYYFSTKAYRSYISAIAAGSNINNLKNEHFDNIDFPVPNLEIQKDIAQFLDTWLPQISLTQNKIQKTKSIIQKFRQSVLSAAVTGKLTADWREKNEIGENAEEFVKNIQKISTKVVTIDKYEKHENLPSWISCKVQNLFSVQTGSTPYRKNESYYLNGTIPWVKTGEVQNCDIYSAEEKITQLAINETNTKTFPINTILIAMYGEGKTRGQVGRLKIEAATNQASAALVNPTIPDYFNEYIYIYCLSQYSKLRQEAVGGNQPNLNLSRIKEWNINVPPEKEQQEIVNRVNKMLEYANIVEKQIETTNKRTDKLTQSILAKAFRGEL